MATYLQFFFFFYFSFCTIKTFALRFTFFFSAKIRFLEMSARLKSVDLRSYHKESIFNQNNQFIEHLRWSKNFLIRLTIPPVPPFTYSYSLSYSSCNLSDPILSAQNTVSNTETLTA